MHRRAGPVALQHGRVAVVAGADGGLEPDHGFHVGDAGRVPHRLEQRAADRLGEDDRGVLGRNLVESSHHIRKKIL